MQSQSMRCAGPARSLPTRTVSLRQSRPQRSNVIVTATAAVEGTARTAAGLRLNLSADTLVHVPLTRESAASLKQAINTLTETLAAKAKATRPQRWPMMEWKLQEPGLPQASVGELEHMEVICNPNAHSTIFEARALISLRTRGGLKLTSEARIPSLQADLDAYLSAPQ